MELKQTQEEQSPSRTARNHWHDSHFLCLESLLPKQTLDGTQYIKHTAFLGFTSRREYGAVHRAWASPCLFPFPSFFPFSSVPSLNYTKYFQGPHACHDAQVKAKEQLPGVGLSSFDCWFPGIKPGASVGLGGKCLYLLSYLVGFPL